MEDFKPKDEKYRNKIMKLIFDFYGVPFCCLIFLFYFLNK